MSETFDYVEIPEEAELYFRLLDNRKVTPETVIKYSDLLKQRIRDETIEECILALVNSKQNIRGEIFNKLKELKTVQDEVLFTIEYGRGLV